MPAHVAAVKSTKSAAGSNGTLPPANIYPAKKVNFYDCTWLLIFYG
jgi:hypothetical protein